jgi:ADP-dependent NAD(P)H-hydrate dehydratase / NAD(P)H-hydrate epimerase
MREWEKASWSAGRTEEEVIRRVGHIVAHKARQMTRPGDLIVVLGGKGHNGDDARHASQNLTEREVYLINVAEPQAALAQLRSQISLQPCLLVDGLFGIGLNRPLDKRWLSLINEINASRIPVMSIDVPSGLNADSGKPLGGAVQAQLTLTLAAPKQGLLLPSAWPFTGRLEVARDIGLVACPFKGNWQWTFPEDFERFPPPRPVAGHKGSFGHAVIIGGSHGYHGASVLSARGALKAAPGLVTLFTSEEVYLPVASQLQAAMVHAWKPGKELPPTTTALLAGPGLADPRLPKDLIAQIQRWWAELPLPMIVDASALEWIPQGVAASGAIRVITPHPGEAARLLKKTAAEIQENRLAAAQELSRCFGNCWVVLKGHQTAVGRSSDGWHVNSSGNPFLAQGGSGDLLSGYLTGLLAQPALSEEPLTSLRFGVWQHGAAADKLLSKQRVWTLEQLPATLGTIEP